MRHALVFVVILPLAGCGLELLGATAIQSGMQADNAQRLTRQLDGIRQDTSRLGFDQAVQAYRAEKGALPPSLDALVAEGYLPSVPLQADGTPYGYDPSTGALTEGTAAPATPAPPQYGNPADDTVVMQEIRFAILKYWQQTRQYPPSLQALVPQYLSSVQTTRSGYPFVYDPVTGTLFHPAEVRGQDVAPASPGAGQTHAPAGGVGPLGEAMTGIGIQQQLNAMPQAGASAAGSRARGSANAAGQDGSARQTRALDELGL
jgi:hypothetical protein